MPKPPKQLRVAEVISETAIVINGGRDEAIEHGDGFIVYEIGPEVFDPETNESLGQLDIKKGQFVAVDVQNRVTIARITKSTITKTRTRPDPFNPLRRLFIKEYEVEVADSVRMDVGEPFYADALVIRKNDLVRSISE